MKKIGYSKGMKVLLYLLIAIASIGGIHSLIGLGNIPTEKNYYSSYYYEDELISKAGYVRDWIVRYADDNILKEEGVTPEDIQRYRSADTSITSDQEAILGILSDRKDYFERIQDELVRNNVNVEYLAINKATGKVITNNPVLTQKGTSEQVIKEVIEEFMNSPTLILGDGESIKKNIREKQVWGGVYPNYYEGNGVPDKNNYLVYVRTVEPLKAGDQFYERAMEYERGIANKDTIYIVAILSCILGLIGLVGWIKVVGRKDREGAIHLNTFDKIPFEVQAVGFGFVFLLWFVCLVRWMDELVYAGWLPCSGDFRIEVLVFNVLIVIGASLGLIFLTSFVKHCKNHSMSRYIFVWSLGKWFMREVITEKTLPVVAVVAIIGWVLVEWFLLFCLFNGWGIFVLFIGMLFLSFNALVIVGLVKLVLDYVKLSRGIEAIVQGNLKPQVKLQFSLPVMRKTADQINGIGEGLEVAVQQSVKSERLKTELITNVSHDLKTPLTSIISYIDLLKEEKIDNETATEYIGILDERSNRLKQLVEDLVEASKAATGNIKSELVPTQLDQLVIQAVGEYTDRLEESKLEVVFGKTEAVNVLADGRHMWRIIENLLSNTCKYAMPGTRVYIDVLEGRDVGQLVIKNISKEALAIDPNELTERFVRGASDRSSEGSGLGLAIATSLAQVQNGTLKLEIDGDLFKAIVEMPKVWKE